MNFFDHQEQARERTSLLVLLYGLSVVALAVVIYATLVGAFVHFAGEAEDPVGWWHPEMLGGTLLGVLLVVGLGTLWKVHLLSAGGSVVAKMLGGRLVSAQTRDPLEKRFLNIVEEMALASGTPVPAAYMLDQEPGINAFAAGLNTRDAVVAVTRGCLEKLNRDELQGVIAHEFSHILNGDMRLNVRLMGVLHGILLVSLIGFYMFRVAGRMGGGRSSRRGKNSGGQFALAFFAAGVVIWLVGLIGVFFANLIKAAVSREREYLADASAVQFTRHPPGLAGALKKIGALGDSGALKTDHAREASHLFFADGMGARLLNLTATHPPLLERIRRLDPRFDGKFDKVVPVAGPESARAAAPPRPASAKTGATRLVALASLAGEAGAPAAGYLAHVEAFLADLSPALKEAAHHPADAQAVIFALLMAAQEPSGRAGLARIVEERAGAEMRRKAESLRPAIEQTPRTGWLTLGDLALTALRQMPAETYENFRATVMALTAADERINLFEYALLRILVRRLDGVFGRARAPGRAIVTLGTVKEECATLLGALARFGQADEAAARAAYEAGVRALFPDSAPAMPDAASCTLEGVDGVMGRLADLRPGLKERLIEACGACAGHDGRVTLDEADLLRAVADGLDCPAPPLALRAA